MLLNYSFNNYKSYRYKNGISFVASKIKQYEEDNISEINASLASKNRVLNSLVFIGVNSAGKTNMLKSISYARYLILNSADAMKDKENIFEDPDIFMFDENAANEPTEFNFEFTLDDNEDVLYYYSFAFCEKEIVYEYLAKRESNDKGRLSSKKVLFERKGTKLVKASEQFLKLSDVFDLHPSVLFLSNCNGNIKEEMCPDGKAVINWFLNIKAANRNNNSLDIYDDNPEYLEIAYKILSYSDKSIKGLRFEKRKLDLGVLDYKNPDAVLKALNSNNVRNVGGSLRLSEDGLYVYDIKMAFDKKAASGDVERIELSIFDDAYNISSGEQKLIIYLAPIIKTLKEGGLLLIDEVETALHYYYSQLLLNLFNNSVTNSKRGQAIITTHNIKLLDEHLRVDQIFTVTKDETGVSVASPLSESDSKSPRKVHKLSERYIEGLYGGVPDINIERIKELFL
ncbi:MAG: ATP-binding protein [Clostridia bacterium]|nr:ATP-binding protein [Clostridia bacterium]